MVIAAPYGDETRWELRSGDYRRLNLVTTKDTYPLPNMADFAERLEGCVIFSKVDLWKGYHQIARRRHPQDGHHYAVWAVGVPPDDLWPQKRW